jgi:hypothetical protein
MNVCLLSLALVHVTDHVRFSEARERHSLNLYKGNPFKPDLFENFYNLNHFILRKNFHYRLCDLPNFLVIPIHVKGVHGVIFFFQVGYIPISPVEWDDLVVVKTRSKFISR